jgi:hypothetical protein
MERKLIGRRREIYENSLQRVYERENPKKSNHDKPRGILL